MRRAAAVALAFAAMAAGLGGDSRREQPNVALETAGRIELRGAPDGGAPVRGTLEEGTAVTVAARQAGWMLLRTKGGGSDTRWGWAVEPKLRGKPR